MSSEEEPQRKKGCRIKEKGETEKRRERRERGNVKRKTRGCERERVRGGVGGGRLGVVCVF